jgi:hypothetical protein
MIQWEECSLDDATHVEINGEVFEIVYGGKVIKSGKLSIDGKYLCISILIGPHDWMQISQEAFPLLGIRCLRKFKPTPIEFEELVVVGTFHGYDVTMLLVPTGISVGAKFRCVQIMEEKE